MTTPQIMSQLRQNFHDYMNLNPLEFGQLKHDYRLSVECDNQYSIRIEVGKINWDIRIEPDEYKDYITTIQLSWDVTPHRALVWVRYSMSDDARDTEPFWKSVVSNGDLSRNTFANDLIPIMRSLFKLNYVERPIYNVSYWTDNEGRRFIGK